MKKAQSAMINFAGAGNEKADARESLFVKSFEGGNFGAAPLRVALIGSHAPRSCGIAAYTADIRSKIAQYCPEIVIDNYPVDAESSGLAHDDDIHLIRAEHQGDYRHAVQTRLGFVRGGAGL